MTHMEGIDKNSASEGIIIIAATNTPKDIDTAILRRFTKKIFIPYPDFDARRVMITRYLENCKVKTRELCEAKSHDQLARDTEGYSASDMVSEKKI
jgi:SpoVK/Ycf46/Vps4 family AAA+-type ATPase